MGRIKTSLIKHKTHEIIEEHTDRLTNDFEKNKEILAEIAEIRSKKLRNAMAGYAARLKKKEV